MAFHKLPPDVRRELLRHVKPPRNSSSPGMNSSNTNTTTSSSTILFACIGLLGGASMIPYIATQWVGGLNDKEDALTAAQVRRGAFMNSGSKDVGRDPNWDFQTGQYKYPPGFAEHLKMQNPNQMDLGPDIHGGEGESTRSRRGSSQ